MAKPQKPIVLITGAAGSIGRALTEELAPDYYVVGFDVVAKKSAHPLIEVDLTSNSSVEHALEQFARGYGKKIAAVVHLAAYFDFTGEENPLYDKVNVEGTRRLLRALQEFEVERFVYSGTMLVRKGGRAWRAHRREDAGLAEMGLSGIEGQGGKNHPQGARKDPLSDPASRRAL